MARAVVTEPRLLLFDEPLSNLDAGLRERMRFELLALQRRLGRTSVYVTHDQAEAMVMSDRIILMNLGRIVQESSPRDLYERPGHRFAAAFVGNANLLDARGRRPSMAMAGSRCVSRAAWSCRGAPRCRAGGPRPGGRALVCIRPEHLEPASDGFPATRDAGELSWAPIQNCELAHRPADCCVPTGRRANGSSRVPGLRLRVDPACVVLLPWD